MKILRYSVMACIFLFLIIFMLSCLPGGAKVLGSYLEITVTGTYYNELLGQITTETEELKAVVNLYPISELSGKGDRVVGGGYFPPSGNSGILYSSATGFDASAPVMTGSGTAHVNGFIAKGPFSEGSQISVALIDENYNRIEIPSKFITDLQSVSDNESEFSIYLPSTDDVEIKINLNALTFIQALRMEALIKEQKKSFYNAYVQSKEEILGLVNLQDSTEEIGDFETMDIRNETDSNGVLLIANSLLAGTNTVGKNTDSILKKVMNQIHDYGIIVDENIGDFLIDRFMNLDIEQIRQNLIDFFGSEYQVPNPEDFLDFDGDGIVNRYDIILTEPVGRIIYDPMPSNINFTWTKPNIPSGTTNVTYILEFCDDPYFPEPFTNRIENIPHPVSGTEVTYDGIDPNQFSLNQQYYWRVKTVIYGVEKRSSASTSFYTTNNLSIAPTGSLKLFTPQYTISRKIIIDTTNIQGANFMRFSLNDQLYDEPYGIEQPFELFRHILLPETTTETSYTIYAEFKNLIGQTITKNINVTLDPNATPTGTFTINNGDPITLSPNVVLNLSGINYAFKMRFADNSYTLEKAEWITFSKKHPYTLPVSSSARKVYGQFINSNGVSTEILSSNEIVYIQPTIMTLYVQDGFKVTVTQSHAEYNGGEPIYERTFLPYNSPYQIYTTGGISIGGNEIDGVTITLTAENIDNNYSFLGFYDGEDSTTSNPYDETIPSNTTVSINVGEDTPIDTDFDVYALTNSAG
jgi:hypothetical protein